MRTESLHSRLGGKGILSSEEKALLGLDIESFIRRMELRIRKVIELKKRGAVAEKDAHTVLFVMFPVFFWVRRWILI